jgi:chromosomal replication initiator protein
MTLTSDELPKWERVRERLRAEVGEESYNSWFTTLEPDRLEGDVMHLSVPTKFLKSWMHAHYIDRVRKRVSAEFAGVQRVTIEVRGMTGKGKTRGGLGDQSAKGADVMLATTPSKPPLYAKEQSPRFNGTSARPQPPRSSSGGAESDAFVGSPLDRRLTFATFQVGPSNYLAHAAATRVAEQRAHAAAPTFNPLYAHASVGLGKTHLLQAMAHAVSEQQRRVLYLTAERFMSAFVSALKDQSAQSFKDSLRSIDLLIVDDVQFLQGKSVQAEFGHLLNALVDAGRQIVVAADRPPAQLDSIDERIMSRLKGGLCVDIGPLDESLRVQILEARIAAAQERHPNFCVPPEVVHLVAHTIVSNGRDLDGAVNRLLAHSTLNGAPVCMVSAEHAIRDLVHAQEPKRVKIDDIQKLVASHYNVSRADILSSRRTANVVLPRQIAMYLAKILTPRSLPEIGRRFGGRDHTTVIHAVKKIEALVAKDRSLAEAIELLKRMLNE